MQQGHSQGENCMWLEMKKNQMYNDKYVKSDIYTHTYTYMISSL